MSDEAKPVAWAVIGDNYEYATLLAEHAVAVAEEKGGIVFPLYRQPQPTLTERWIPISERMPLERPAESWETLERAVIVWDGKDVYEATYYAGSDPQECCWSGCRWAGKDIKPTHWMPLPEPPEVK